MSGHANSVGLLLLALASEPCIAESAASSSRAAEARLRFTIVVPPVFRVLSVTPATGGQAVRVWTNQPSAIIDGRSYRFPRAGENTIVVPATGDGQRVHGL